METALSIRQVGAEDYDRLRGVIAETFAFHQRARPEFFRPTTTPPPSRENIEELLADGSGVLLVAQERDEVIGFLTICVRQVADEPFLTQCRLAVVDNVGVKAAWRRRGIGRRLMEAAHEWARQYGASRVQLNVWEFNEGAIALYESLGYETVSRQMWKAL